MRVLNLNSRLLFRPGAAFGIQNFFNKTNMMDLMIRTTEMVGMPTHRFFVVNQEL